jgi:hypothetical protein
MKKGPAAILVVLGMVLGSVLTTVLNPIGAASALVGASSSGHETILQQALDTLVGKGTITKPQADAVQNQVHSLEQQHEKDFGAHHLGPFLGGPAMGAMGMGPHGAFEQLFSALKTDPKALFDELKSGKTIAQIAKEKGIDVAQLRQQLITTANNGIDQAVKSGWMSAAEAAKLKAKVAGDVDQMLNRSWNQGFHLPMHSGPGVLAPHTGGTTTTTTH